MTDKIQQAEMAENIRDARRAMFMDAMEKRNAEREKQYLDALTMGEVSHAWWAFNAALDAVEIELPNPGAAMASVFDYQHSTRNKNVTGTTNWAANVGMVVVDDCRDAIESTNLGIKVK